jgi:hypothetical protein
MAFVSDIDGNLLELIGPIEEPGHRKRPLGKGVAAIGRYQRFCIDECGLCKLPQQRSPPAPAAWSAISCVYGIWLAGF